MTELTPKEQDAYFEACAHGRLRAVERLLTKCPETLDRANADGWTGLMLAVQWAQEETVDFLLSKGADLNVPDRNGLTAQQQAEQLNFASTAALFNAVSQRREREAAQAAREEAIQQFNRGLDAPLRVQKCLQVRKK